MRNLWTVWFLASALLVSTAGAAEDPRRAALDAYPGVSEHAKMIRKGRLDLGRRYSMHEENGRFHVIHVDEIDLECTSCHVGDDFAKDYLLLRKEQAVKKAHGIGKGDRAGVIDRSVCLGCHLTGGIATRWYRTVAE